MCVSRSLFLAGAMGLLVAIPAVQAADGGRLDLLASEATQVLDPSAQAALPTGLLVWIGVPLATLVAAFLGTWLGIRGPSFGSRRDQDGWREVAFRFRSDQPMTVGKEVIRRMSGVLDDIEDLGKRIRSRSSAALSAASASPAAAPAPAAPSAPLAVSMPRPVAPPPVRPVREVTFVRREEAPPPPPVARPTRTAPGVDAAERSRRPAEPVVAARPVAFPAEREGDRGTRYRRARALLQDGHDRETVRSMTGLKLAELDLLRCAGGPIGGAS